MSDPVAHGRFENVRQDSLPRQPRSDATVEKTSFPTASIFVRSVLQCVAVGVLQCVTMCCSVMQCFAVCCTDTCVPTASIFVQCVLVSVLQCVAVSVWQRAAVCCSVLPLWGLPTRQWAAATMVTSDCRKKPLSWSYQYLSGLFWCVAVCCSVLQWHLLSDPINIHHVCVRHMRHVTMSKGQLTYMNESCLTQCQRVN